LRLCFQRRYRFKPDANIGYCINAFGGYRPGKIGGGGLRKFLILFVYGVRRC
jgi:hypothetical protein